MMRLVLLGLAIFVGLALATIMPATAGPTDPVTRINIYVTPYYAATDGKPIVRVAPEFDALLASDNPADIIAVRDAIKGKPELITPMTLMVLAIRFYDVGLRDDAVFWFYAAKYRYFTVNGVLDMESPSLVEAKAAINSFAVLAGPYFNSYAFCDFDKQHESALAALEWARSNRYAVIDMGQLPARPGDRSENLEKAIDGIAKSITKEWTFLSDQKNRAEMVEKRKANHVPEQFCWRS